MPLIDLKTNLRDLKFGRDRINGGSSNQPYITSPIPDLDKESGEFSFLNQDFILRGGSKAVVNSIKDVERLGKYFLDIRNPSGLLFIAKQNLLSRTAVRTQASGKLINEGAYTPISTLAQAGGNAFGLHVNKQGLNPFSGLLSTGDFTPNQYADKIRLATDESLFDSHGRLPVLYGYKILNDESTLDRLNGIKVNSGGVNVLSYIGGPGSTLGIGNTNIKFADQRTGVNNPNYGKDNNYQSGLKNSQTNRTDIPLDYRNALGLSVSSSYYENGNVSLPIINLSNYTGVVGEVNGAIPYYVGKNTNVTIGNLIGDTVNVYQKYGHNVDVNYRNALGLSVSSSYNAKNKVNLGDAKYSGINPKGQGTSTTKYIGKDSKISINNIITGVDLKNYQSGLKNSHTYKDQGIDAADNIFINYKKFLGLSTKYPIPASNDEEMKDLNPNAFYFPEGVVTFDQSDIINIPTVPSTGSSTLTQKGATTVTGDFRKTLNYNLPTAPNYTTKNIEQRVLLGNPGDRSLKNLLSYTNGTKPGAIHGYSGGNASINSYDKINALPIYSDTTPDEKNGNDLVKFRIGVIDNNNPSRKTYIHFRAFINQITDQYSSEWSDTRYIGRGEKFYTYTGFDRKVSLSWTVAAQSKAELIPMYKKLNFLASICAPDYSAAGYMRGNIVTLTIGGYFYEQPGIITGFSYEMNDDNATWEIGIGDDDDASEDKTVKELPHLIKVSGFNFTPIHTFVPRKQQMKYDSQGDILTDANGYGPERYIALANGFGDDQNNYGPVYKNPVPEKKPVITDPPVPAPKQDLTSSTTGNSSKDPIPQKLPPQQKSTPFTGSIEFGGGSFGGGGSGGNW